MTQKNELGGSVSKKNNNQKIDEKRFSVSKKNNENKGNKKIKKRWRRFWSQCYFPWPTPAYLVRKIILIFIHIIFHLQLRISRNQSFLYSYHFNLKAKTDAIALLSPLRCDYFQIQRKNDSNYSEGSLFTVLALAMERFISVRK